MTDNLLKSNSKKLNQILGYEGLETEVGPSALDMMFTEHRPSSEDGSRAPRAAAEHARAKQAQEELDRLRAERDNIESARRLEVDKARAAQMALKEQMEAERKKLQHEHEEHEQRSRQARAASREAHKRWDKQLTSFDSAGGDDSDEDEPSSPRKGTAASSRRGTDAQAAQVEVTALSSYTATATDELSFVEGDTIRVLHQLDDDWWLGQLGEHTGLFPLSYVDHRDAAVGGALPSATPARHAHHPYKSAPGMIGADLRAMDNGRLSGVVGWELSDGKTMRLCMDRLMQPRRLVLKENGPRGHDTCTEDNV